MSQPQTEIEVLNLDHLELVAGTIDELGLVEEVNQHLGIHPNEKVSAGQVLSHVDCPEQAAKLISILKKHDLYPPGIILSH